jgi:two-component system, OmpR family, sensor histidine kinase CpxA
MQLGASLDGARGGCDATGTAGGCARGAGADDPAGERTPDLFQDQTALAEPELLPRAVANLVRNALRYAGHAGPVRLHARAGGSYIFLTVSNEGPGVAEAELDRIFEHFYRPDSARTREAGGTGLDLAIVRTCADA